MKPAATGTEATTLSLSCDDVELNGDLHLPTGARAIVLFAHGSGSGRHSPRNRYMAQRLHQEKLGTLLLDLLTVDEEREDMMTSQLRFDIPLLARRLLAATNWARSNPATQDLAIGYYGSSTGAAAALEAAAREPEPPRAIVSRGGRPDLSLEILRHVVAPTLLIVGESDPIVLESNREAITEMRCLRALQIVPGATHLFEEKGALEHASDLAAEWFAKHLTAPDKTPTSS